MSRIVRKNQHAIFQPATPTSKIPNRPPTMKIRGSTIISVRWDAYVSSPFLKRKGDDPEITAFPMSVTSLLANPFYRALALTVLL
jgi:hypothetical protein